MFLYIFLTEKGFRLFRSPNRKLFTQDVKCRVVPSLITLIKVTLRKGSKGLGFSIAGGIGELFLSYMFTYVLDQMYIFDLNLKQFIISINVGERAIELFKH